MLAPVNKLKDCKILLVDNLQNLPSSGVRHLIPSSLLSMPLATSHHKLFSFSFTYLSKISITASILSCLILISNKHCPFHQDYLSSSPAASPQYHDISILPSESPMPNPTSSIPVSLSVSPIRRSKLPRTIVFLVYPGQNSQDGRREMTGLAYAMIAVGISFAKPETRENREGCETCDDPI